MIKCRVSYDRVCKTGGVLRVKRMQNYKPEIRVSNTFFEIQLETGRVSLFLPRYYDSWCMFSVIFRPILEKRIKNYRIIL